MHNILMIILDTLRRDRLSAYGGSRETSPSFDAFAAEGTLYTRAIAPAQWTIPAHASLFTGTMPTQHGLTQASAHLPDALPTLAEQLQDAGYHTVAFCNNALVGAIDHGLQRGFDKFFNYATAVPYRPNDHLKPYVRREFSRRFRPYARRMGNVFARNDSLFRMALNPLLVPLWTRYINFKGHTAHSLDDLMDYLDAHNAGGADRPLFAFVNLMGAHLPYIPPQDAIDHLAPSLKRDKAAYQFVRGFNADAAAWASPPEPPLKDWQRQALLDFYDAEIFAQDQHIGRLIAHLKQTGALANTTVIIAADHGEGHGDHNLFGHGFDTYQELAHVPLAIYGERFAKGAVNDDNISTRRLYHTILDLAGVSPHPNPSPSGRGAKTASAGSPLDANLLSSSSQWSGDLSLSLTNTTNPEPAPISEAVPPSTFLHVLEHRNPSVIERMRLRELRRAVYDGDHKLMLTGDQPVALFNVAQDPAETRNLIKNDPTRVEALRQQAGIATPAVDPVEQAQDEQVLEHLRALGYVD